MTEHDATTIDLSSIALQAGLAKKFDIQLYLSPLHLAGQDYRFIPETVPAELSLTFTGKGHAVSMFFSCRLEGVCWRCLEPADLDLEVRVDDFFESELPPLEELGEGDEPTLWYDEDGIINLSYWARDAVAEMLPPKILCRPGCKGLCPQCGADLNLVDCGCEAPADFRWDKLKDWKPE